MFEIPRKYEEVSQLHQSQRTGLVAIFRSQNEITVNMEALLTLHVQNQHAVTHFKRDTFTFYEYAMMFGTSVQLRSRVSKWAAAYYTHLNSLYYKLPTSGAVSLPRIKIPKPTSQEITRNG